MAVRVIRYVFCVGVCLLAGWVSGYVSGSGSDGWYGSLDKPWFTPPGWVFGVVWPILYAMMGIAAAMVWERGFRLPTVRLALAAFGVQLLLNLIWSPIFFGMHRIGLALVDIFLLWIAIAVCAAMFWKVRPVAAVLMLPYLAWVSFAVVLNFTFWKGGIL